MRDEEFTFVELPSPSDSQIKEFCAIYDQFARRVNIKDCDFQKLKSIRDQGALVISYIKDKNNQIICTHARLWNKRQYYGVYSALNSSISKESVNGQHIGRANKLLDWTNILRAKQRGCTWYNFGGQILDPNE